MISVGTLMSLVSLGLARQSSAAAVAFRFPAARAFSAGRGNRRRIGCDLLLSDLARVVNACGESRAQRTGRDQVHPRYNRRD